MAWSYDRAPASPSPPAESPSTMKISDSEASLDEQSASLPGSANESSTFLRRVISRALRAASRALRAWVALPMIRFAGAGFSSRNSASPFVTAPWTRPRISVFPSFVFVVALKLGIVQLHGDDGREALARTSSPERFGSLSFKRSLASRIFVDRARQGVLETVEVRAALVGVDVVGKRHDRVGRIAGRPLNGDFDRAVFAFRLEINRLVEGFLALVDILDEVNDAAVGLERFAVRSAVRLDVALVTVGRSSALC